MDALRQDLSVLPPGPTSVSKQVTIRSAPMRGVTEFGGSQLQSE